MVLKGSKEVILGSMSRKAQKKRVLGVSLIGLASSLLVLAPPYMVDDVGLHVDPPAGKNPLKSVHNIR